MFFAAAAAFWFPSEEFHLLTNFSPVHVPLALAQVGQQLELLDRPCLCARIPQSQHAEVTDLCAGLWAVT